MMFPFVTKENKYQRWYEKLVEKRIKTSPIDEYVESHHIVPRSIGGSDAAENRVYFTAREHYIAHLLLTKIDMPEKFHKKMLYAYHMMATMNGGNKKSKSLESVGVPYKVSARVYEILRKEVSDTLSKRMKQLYKDNPRHVMFVRTEAQKKRISESTKKLHLDPIFRSKYEEMLKRRVNATPEEISRATKEGMAKPEARARYLAGISKRVIIKTPECIARTNATKILRYGHAGPVLTEESRKRISEKNRGRKRTSEQRAALSVAAKNSFNNGRKTWNQGRTDLPKHSDETRRRMRESHQKRKELGIKRAKTKNPARTYELVECPHCHKVGSGNGMCRWHFDKCKHKNTGILPI